MTNGRRRSAFAFVASFRRRRPGFTLLGLLLAMTLCGLVFALLALVRDMRAGSPNSVERAFFSEDGSKLVATFREGNVEIYGTGTGKRLWRHEREVPIKYGSNDQIERLSPDGRLLAIVIDDNSSPGSDIQIWDWANDRQLLSLQIKDWTRGFELSPDGTQAAFFLYRKGLAILDVATAEYTTHVIPLGGSGFGLLIAYSPDGRQIAVGGGRHDGTGVFLFDVATCNARELESLPKMHATSGLGFSPDGRTLVACAEEGGARVSFSPPLVHVWDDDNYSHLRTVNFQLSFNRRLKFSPDSSTMLVRFDQTRQLDLKTLALTNKGNLPVEALGASFLDISPTTSLAAAAGDAERILLFDTNTGEQKRTVIHYGIYRWRLGIIITGFAVWTVCFVSHWTRNRSRRRSAVATAPVVT